MVNPASTNPQILQFLPQNNSGLLHTITYLQGATLMSAGFTGGFTQGHWLVDTQQAQQSVPPGNMSVDVDETASNMEMDEDDLPPPHPQGDSQ